jgi:hypothetical protein
MNWYYRVKAKDEKVRDPIEGEFFSTEAIKSPADALVREAIQNALDARLKHADGQPEDVLRVRFFLATGTHALPCHQVAHWFEGAWEHSPQAIPPYWTDFAMNFGSSGLLSLVCPW